MQDDISAARRAIMALAHTKVRRRYPSSLRAQLAILVRAHPEHSVGTLARLLGMAPLTLQRIVEPGLAASLVPVRIVDAPLLGAELRVRGPQGILVEGLTVAGVAELIRALA